VFFFFFFFFLFLNFYNVFILFRFSGFELFFFFFFFEAYGHMVVFDWFNIYFHYFLDKVTIFVFRYLQYDGNDLRKNKVIKLHAGRYKKAFHLHG
jgi:hypothetical protein